jgi:hypothetical protein
LPYTVAHADVLQQRIDQAPADRDLVRLSLSDDLYWRSVYWAAWSLGMRLPVKPGEDGSPQRRHRAQFNNDPTPATAHQSTVRHGYPAIRPRACV